MTFLPSILLSDCNGQEGSCPFCGTEGLCCRYDEIKDINSGCKGNYVMEKGKIITGKHVCTSRQAPKEANLGRNSTELLKIFFEILF